MSEPGAQFSEFPHIFPLANSTKMILPALDYDLILEKLRHMGAAVAQPNVAKLTMNPAGA